MYLPSRKMNTRNFKMAKKQKKKKRLNGARSNIFNFYKYIRL